MKLTKQQRETRQIEMVETYNIFISIQRMREAGPYDPDKWKRSLYHALSMGQTNRATLEKIRPALELP